MTRDARLLAGVLLGIHGSEPRGPASIGGVTANAELATIRARWLPLVGGARMSLERTMTSFARHGGMPRAHPHLDHVRVALGTGDLAGVNDRLGAVVLQRARAIVPQPAEVLGHEGAANHDEEDEAAEEEARQPKQMLDILEPRSHPESSLSRSCTNGA